MKHKEYKFNGRKIINTIIKYFGGGIEKINKHIAQLIVKTDESLDSSGSGNNNFVRINSLLQYIDPTNIIFVKKYEDAYIDSSKVLYLYVLEGFIIEDIIITIANVDMLNIIPIETDDDNDIDDIVYNITNFYPNYHTHIMHEDGIYEGFCFFHNGRLYCGAINMENVDCGFYIPITNGLYIKE